MKHTLRLRALTEEDDADYKSRNDDFERCVRHFLKTNICRLTKDVWMIQTDCSYEEVYEFLEDYSWGFFEFISLDNFTDSLQLYDYVWEQRRNAEVYDNMPKATKKSISKPALKFNDMVQKQRSKNSAVVKNDDEYPPYISDYKELKNGIFNYLNRYDSAEYLQLIFSLLADDSYEYEQLWDEWYLHWF